MDAMFTVRSVTRILRFSWLVVLFFVLIQRADSNYEALYEYGEDRYRNPQASYVGEDPVRIKLDQPIRYYGQRYTTVTVSRDGTVSFGDSEVGFRQNPRWPRGFTELTQNADKPFIAPLHHQGYVSDDPQKYQGSLFRSNYTRSNLANDERSRHQLEFLNYLGKYLSHSAVTVGQFRPEQYVMVTWENVTNYRAKFPNSSCDRTESSPCPGATFQVVIVADATHTFVIFNYGKIDLPYHPSLLAGMNGGLGRGWTDVVKCKARCRKNKHQAVILAQLPQLQGTSQDDALYRSLALRAGTRHDLTNIRGRFVFLVTNDVIVRGGCLPEDSKVGYLDTVEVDLPQVDMLGGQIIRVSGQCQEEFTTVYCRFDGNQDLVSEGKLSTGMTGWCPVPRLSTRGRVKLEVSSNRNRWNVYTFLTVMPPVNTAELMENPVMQPWFERGPEQLQLSWNRTQLRTLGEEEVDIVLMQYTEQGEQVVWKELKTLAEKQPNTGVFQFSLKDDYEYRFSCRENCGDIKLGVVEVRLTEDTVETAVERRSMAVGPVPMGWYVNRYYTEIEDDWDWPASHCYDWSHRASQDRHWTTELPPCPCTLQQALADWGRFQPDTGCSLFHGSRKCFFNQGAKTCVRSVKPARYGAGSHCCYDNQDNLVYAADFFRGSKSSRSQLWGVKPFNSAGNVPAMSHWLNDLVPYYLCCRWSSDDYCNYYTRERPTRDCRYYDPPGSAIIYGDPHVTTFDNVTYHFGGDGDFWLVQSPLLHVQARFLERESRTILQEKLEAYLKPTHITSVVISAAEKASDIVTFSLAPPGDLHPRRLDVKVNDRHYFFDDPSLMWQDFEGFSIINNQRYRGDLVDSYHSNFTVLLDSAAGVQVSERSGLLNVLVQLPPFRNEEGNPSQEPLSRGLLGTWDENRANEFMFRGRSSDYMSLAESETKLYNGFAMKWAVREEESMFQFHREARNDKSPLTGPARDNTDARLRPDDGLISSTCGAQQGQGSRDSPCARDYYLTGNASVARDTRHTQEVFGSLRRSQEEVWSCGWLDIPYAEKDSYDYRRDSTVRVTGCRAGPDSTGSMADGPTQFTCVQNETDHQPFWNPYEYNHYLCTEDTDDAMLGIIIGVSVGAVVIIIIVIVGVVIYRRRRSKGTSVSKPKASAREEATMDPGTDETLMKRPARNEYAMSERKKEKGSIPV